MNNRTGIARRLTVGFGVLLVLLGFASVVTLAGIEQVRSSMQEARRLEDVMRNVLSLSTALRDQYAHQAHMILLGDDSHMMMYQGSLGWVDDLTQDLLASVEDEGSRQLLRQIATASRNIDALFRDDILPAVLSGDRDRAEVVHDEALGIVLEAQVLSGRVSEQMRASIAGVEKEAAKIHRRSYLNSFVLLVGALLFAAAMVLWIIRSVLHPVALLHAGASRLADGDLTTRIRVDSKDELGRLAGQFNLMAEAIARHQVEIARSERLAGVGRLAAGVAHEINNPLAVILGYIRLIQNKLTSAADSALDIEEDLAVIDEETKRCKSIVDDLLHLARPIGPGKEPVDLRELCEQASERLKDSASSEVSEVSVVGEAQVSGSARALYQVMVNLIKNAMDASGPAGQVRVQLHQENDGARIRVDDSGPGLSKEVMERLFEPFHSMKVGGTGLGLAVSRAIVDAHGGRVEAENLRGAGARFVVYLPVVQ